MVPGYTYERNEDGEDLSQEDIAIANLLHALENDNYLLCLSANIDAEFPDDPTTFKQAMDSPDADKWLKGCKEELAAIQRLGVYTLVKRSTALGRRIMHGKFVFRSKRNEIAEIIRWKVRWVVKGYEAVYGVDYKKTVAPTMRLETLRIITHVAAAFGWSLHQIDIVTAFLRGKLKEGEEVYMEQPEGFAVPGHKDWIWMLTCGLYGLPQGSRIWNKTMHDGMIKLGFTRIKCEYCLYFRRTATGIILTGIHVDDFLTAASSIQEVTKFKAKLRTIWEISDLGEARFCVGIAIERDLANKHIYLSQTALIDKILTLFKMTNSNDMSTPMDTKVILSKFSRTPLTAAETADLKTIPYRQLVGCYTWPLEGRVQTQVTKSDEGF